MYYLLPLEAATIVKQALMKSNSASYQSENNIIQTEVSVTVHELNM